MGKIERIQVPGEDWDRLEHLVKDRNTPQKIVWRARIVLLAGDPKPFIWTKSAREIFEKIARAKQALESLHRSAAGRPRPANFAGSMVNSW
jgi:hypothetical protein